MLQIWTQYDKVSFSNKGLEPDEGCVLLSFFFDYPSRYNICIAIKEIEVFIFAVFLIKF